MRKYLILLLACLLGGCGSTSSGSNSSSTTPNTTPVRFAAGLAFVVQPASSIPGGLFNPAVQVSVVDVNGNVVTTATNPISIALSSNPSGATLGGTLTQTPVGGVATFSDLTVSLLGSSYTLIASSSGLTSATSQPFNVGTSGPTASPSGSPTQLSFNVSPSNSAANGTIPPFQVTLEDSNGTPTLGTSSVSLSLASNLNNPNGATLTGQTTVQAVGGVATFTNVTVTSPANGIALIASSSGLTSATSQTFNVSAPVGQLVFTTQPASAGVNATLGPVVVQLHDVNGNLLVNSVASVNLSLNGTTNGTLAGNTTLVTVGGVAAFSGLQVSAAGNYTFTASATGFTQAVSSSFQIGP